MPFGSFLCSVLGGIFESFRIPLNNISSIFFAVGSLQEEGDPAFAPGLRPSLCHEHPSGPCSHSVLQADRDTDSRWRHLQFRRRRPLPTGQAKVQVALRQDSPSSTHTPLSAYNSHTRGLSSKASGAPAPATAQTTEQHSGKRESNVHA